MKTFFSVTFLRTSHLSEISSLVKEEAALGVGWVGLHSDNRTFISRHFERTPERLVGSGNC